MGIIHRPRMHLNWIEDEDGVNHLMIHKDDENDPLLESLCGIHLDPPEGDNDMLVMDNEYERGDPICLACLSAIEMIYTDGVHMACQFRTTGVLNATVTS